MIENKKHENENESYWSAYAYTPYSIGKPKLHEMGFFSDNMVAFDNLKDPELYYVYGELIDYNADCKGQYYIDDDNEDYERRYRCEFEETDFWCGTDYYEENFAFYIPESSIPQEKREWYRSLAINLVINM